MQRLEVKDLDSAETTPVLESQRRRGAALPAPHIERTQKAYLNAVSSLLDYGARIGISLVVTPILVAGLGDVLFGVWQILTRMVSYMSAADGQPTQALKWVVSHYQDSDDLGVRRRAIGSALSVWLIMLPLLALVGVGAVWIAPAVVRAPGESVTVVRMACALLVINLVLMGLVALPAAVLRGMNLGYKRMGFVASMNIVGGLLMAGVVYLEWGLVGVATAYLVQTAATGVLLWYVAKSYLPWFGIERVRLQDIRQFFGLSIWYGAWNLVSKLLVSSDTVVLGVLLSASVVTDYVLTGYVAQTIVVVVATMLGAAAPGLGGLIAQQRYKRISDLRNEMLWMSSLVSGVLGSMVLLWNRSFMRLWVGSEHYAGLWVNLLLVLIAVQLLFLRNEMYLIDLTLNVRPKVLLGLVSAVLSVGLAVALAHPWGVPGFCMGILGGRLLLTVVYPSLTAGLLQVSLAAQFSPLLRPGVAMAVLFAVSAYAGEIVLARSWIEMLLYASVSLSVVSVAFLWGGFSRAQRMSLLRRVMKLKPLELGS